MWLLITSELTNMYEIEIFQIDIEEISLRNSWYVA